MNGVWKKVWLKGVHSFTGFPQVCPVIQEIVQPTHAATKEEVEEEDINELLA